MIIRQITDVIERFAPLEWQESYDNAGLIVGRPDDEVHKACWPWMLPKRCWTRPKPKGAIW